QQPHEQPAEGGHHHHRPELQPVEVRGQGNGDRLRRRWRGGKQANPPQAELEQGLQRRGTSGGQVGRRREVGQGGRTEGGTTHRQQPFDEGPIEKGVDEAQQLVEAHRRQAREGAHRRGPGALRRVG
ncbi:MAG: hypothetical protein ACK559_40955, partial [bacterium]